MELWNEEYPEYKRTLEEVEATYLHGIEGGFEENWLADDRACALVAVDPNGHIPPQHVYADVLSLHKLGIDAWAEAVKFLHQRTMRMGASYLSIWIKGTRTDCSSWLNSNGYELAQSVPVSRLEIAKFDPSHYNARIQVLRDQGVCIETAAELNERAFDWIPKLFKSSIEMIEDMPHDEPIVHETLDDFRNRLQNKTAYDPDLMFFAIHGDDVIGYSRLKPSFANRGLAETGLSGTIRAWRRRGVVTALKVAGIEKMRGLGYRWIQTDNDETNPMYRLNLDLGYERIFDWERYKTKFEQDSCQSNERIQIAQQQ